MQDVQERLGRVEGFTWSLKRRQDELASPYMFVVEGSTEVERLYASTVGTEDGGGFRALKERVSGVLAKEMAGHLQLTRIEWV